LEAAIVIKLAKSESSLSHDYHVLKSKARSRLEEAMQSGRVEADSLVSLYRAQSRALGNSQELETLKDRFIAESALSCLIRAIAEQGETCADDVYWFHGVGVHLPEIKIYEWLTSETSPLVHDGRFLDLELVRSLIELHDQMIPDLEKKKLGRYYTPVSIASHLLDNAAYVSGQPIENLRLIDPACGGGIFLSIAARRMTRRTVEVGENFSRLPVLLSDNLFGRDVQAFAIVLTKLYIIASVLAELSEAGNERNLHGQILTFPNIRVGDTLRDPDIDEAVFDLIIGNPPFTEVSDDIDLEKYQLVLNGRPNLFTLFLHWAVTHCVVGGRIAFLLPASFKSGLFFRKLRQHLSQKTSPLAFTVFKAREGIFDSVQQDLLGVVLQKREQGQTIDVDGVETKIVHCRDGESLTLAASSYVSAKSIILPESHGLSFCIGRSASDYNIVGKMVSESNLIKDLGIRVSTGSFVWNEHKERLEEAKSDTGAPVIYANSVRPYRLVFPPDSSNPGRTSYFARLVPKTKRLLMSNELLLVKRTTNRGQRQRIVAALCGAQFTALYPQYFVENHVNFLTATSTSRVDLYYLMGLLNSKLLNFFFGLINGNTHVSASELRFMPIKIAERNIVTGLVKERINAIEPQCIAEIEVLLDNAVYDMYALSVSEREAVRSWFEDENGDR
jgi:adenine-specific DNA-methyltransferase